MSGVQRGSSQVRLCLLERVVPGSLERLDEAGEVLPSRRLVPELAFVASAERPHLKGVKGHQREDQTMANAGGKGSG